MRKRKTENIHFKTAVFPLAASVIFLVLFVYFAAAELFDFSDTIYQNLFPVSEIEPVFVKVLPEAENYPEKLTGKNGFSLLNELSDFYLKEESGVTYIYYPQYELIVNEGTLTSLSFNEYKMLLVNKNHSIPEDYTNDNPMGYEAAGAMEEMISAAGADGINFWVQSGYRSYSTQAAIHERYHQKYDAEYVDSISAEAGHSEHQTGLAFDLNGDHGGGLSSAFAGTPEYEWLTDHAEEYGFILRFAEGKEWATGYAYEPWHFRYVGKELAEILNTSGKTVEENINEPWNPASD